ncbi:MAG TPA: 1,4-dihydroxy-2-naphthoate polyprenyltransferase, partial [Acidimicrobiia bacterium]|nr:1,4-dihydroxy-2-naphthoate polyprenyltransferase [Acidimicrobiia bacterium]
MTPLEAWKTAARPHTLPAAIVPVLVGSGLAYGEGVFRGDAFFWALLGALAIQVAANFANDASDARRGADNDDRLGPPRMVALGVISSRQ